MTAGIAFGQLASWIERGDVGRVAAALYAADEQDRRNLVKPLRALPFGWMPVPDESAPQPGDDDMSAYLRRESQWQRHEILVRRREGAMRVAGAACLPRAADIVSWLRSDRFWHDPEPKTIDALVLVLQAPGRPSLAAIAQGMAAKLRPAQVDRQWPIISRLLETAGVPTSATEATVRGWMREFSFAADPQQLASRLRSDPRTPVLLPHVFAIARVCGELGEEWPPALARLCADGHYDRQTLLESCLLRLRAGDRPTAIKSVVQLHALLDPALDEYAAHRQEYLGMLPSPHLAVAELALRALRAVDDAGQLDVDTIVEAAYAILPRPEKKLVRAQLGWLAAALDRGPDLRLLEGVAAGIGNTAVDLAERALHLAGQYLPAFGEAGHRVLADAAAGLDGDLRRQADALLATTVAPTTVTAVTGIGLLSVESPAPMPAPIASVAELAGAVAALLRDPNEPVLLERMFAGLTAFAQTDRPALARALQPLVPDFWDSPLVSLLRAAIHGRWAAWKPQQWELKHAAPFWMIAERANELGRQMCADPPPALLATPATVDGHVDPARVLALLSAAETDGWQPGPVDLSQALLRLPRQFDPGLSPAADRLTSPAGRTFAAWLRDGGLPDPTIVTLPAAHRPCTHVEADQDGLDDYRCWCLDQPGVRRTVAFASAGHPLLTVPAGLLSLPADAAYERAYGLHRETPMACWPMMLPGHREIIAAQAQPLLVHAADGNYSSQLDILPVLARSSGPFGPAMALCLAYGLAAGRPAGRLATIDAFVLLAAHGDLDGAMIGRELAALHTNGMIVVKRVTAALTEALPGGGDHIWALILEFMPAVLTSTPLSPGAPDLLALAESVATTTGAADDLPDVAAIAARGGRSRLVTEAGRLHRTLASNQTREPGAIRGYSR